MNMFQTAKKAPVKNTAKKANATPETVAIEGLQDFAAVCAVMTSLDAIKKSLEGGIKAEGSSIIIAEGVRLKRRPENIKAADGAASASIQLKAKASNIAIPEEDQAILAEDNIPLKTTDNVTKTFIINPEYANDEGLLAKVAKALSKVPGLPTDFIQMQEDTKVVCDGDNTLNAIFALGDADKVNRYLPLVTSVAVKPTFTEDVERAIEIVSAMLGAPLADTPKPSAKVKKAAKKADCEVVA